MPAATNIFSNMFHTPISIPSLRVYYIVYVCGNQGFRTPDLPSLPALLIHSFPGAHQTAGRISVVSLPLLLPDGSSGFYSRCIKCGQCLSFLPALPVWGGVFIRFWKRQAISPKDVHCHLKNIFLCNEPPGLFLCIRFQFGLW